MSGIDERIELPTCPYCTDQNRNKTTFWILRIDGCEVFYLDIEALTRVCLRRDVMMTVRLVANHSQFEKPTYNKDDVLKYLQKVDSIKCNSKQHPLVKEGKLFREIKDDAIKIYQRTGVRWE